MKSGNYVRENSSSLKQSPRPIEELAESAERDGDIDGKRMRVALSTFEQKAAMVSRKEAIVAF